MAKIDPVVSLGDLVTMNPSIARPLEQLGLDYCCHGDRSLAAAVSEAGLDLDAVVAALAVQPMASEAPDWAHMAPGVLATHVEETHHKFLWDELPRTSLLVDKIKDVHGSRHPELAEVQRLYAQLRVELEPHMRREELRIFPTIRNIDQADHDDLRVRIDQLITEHDAAGELLETLRDITDGFTPPDDGCNTYRACYIALADIESDTHLHVHKENNLLFPAVLKD